MDQAQFPRQYVRDLITVGVPTCSQNMPAADLARRLLDEDLEGIVVLDEDGHAVGVVTRDDLVRAYCQSLVDNLTAEDVMSEDVPELPPDIPLKAAAQLMRDQGHRAVYLMHNAGGIRYPAAMLTYKHFLRHMSAQDDADLEDLGIKAARRAPLDVFKEKRDAARRRASHIEE